MTELLERVIAQLKTLPTEEQDAIATLILEELEEDQQWDESFARSPDLLAKLAAEAMAEYHAGKTQELVRSPSCRVRRDAPRYVLEGDRSQSSHLPCHNRFQHHRPTTTKLSRSIN